MDDFQSEQLDFDVTQTLKAFLRAELELVMSFETSDGSKWNNLSVARAINESDDISGHIGDDTITRFRNPDHKQQIRKPALMAIAEFLIASEFITREDLEHYSKPEYSRAAASLSQLFLGATSETDREFNKSLIGEYRLFRQYRHTRLLETRLVIASPDKGASLTVSETCTVHKIEELDWIQDETNNLDREHYARIPELIETSEGVQEVRFLNRGAGIATESFMLFLLGGEEQIDNSVMNIRDVSFNRNGIINGLKGHRVDQWIKSMSGQDDPTNQPEQVRHVLAKHFQQFILYPQGIKDIGAPAFISDSESLPKPGSLKDGLGFQGPAPKNMSEAEQRFVSAENVDLDIDTALMECPDATSRLTAAISLFCTDHAIAAIKDGADVNTQHPAYRLPLIHTVASLGMRPLAKAMLDHGGCDLTVRDRFNRLASSCADNCAEDFDLRDDLIEAQNARFREKNIDPRRPNVPGYGSYILGRRSG